MSVTLRASAIKAVYQDGPHRIRRDTPLRRSSQRQSSKVAGSELFGFLGFWYLVLIFLFFANDSGLS